MADPPAARGRQWLSGPELARAAAAVAVVLIHTSAWAGGSLFLNINTATRFSVPAFVILSGLLTAYAARGGRRSPLLRRLRRTVVPWLAWAPLYLVLSLWAGDLPRTAHDILVWVEGGGGHLYFLLLIPQLYVAYRFWPRSHRWALAAAFLTLQMLLGAVRLYLPIHGFWQSWFTIWWGYMYFPYWLGYFALGVAIGGELRAARQRPTLWIAGTGLATVLTYIALDMWAVAGSPLPAYGGGTGAFIVPLMTPFAVAATLFLLSVGTAAPATEARWWPVVRTLSDASLGIYIVHPGIVTLAKIAVGSQPIHELASSWWGFFVFSGGLLLAAWVVTEALRRSPLSWSIGSFRESRG